MANVYQIITDRIIEKLESGVVPWHKPWKGSLRAPKNLVSGRAYRGINTFTLASAGYESPYWLTFKQARDRGGTVKKGARGLPVVFWKWLDTVQDEEPERAARAAREAQAATKGRAESTKSRGFPLYFTVFNVQQTDGVPYPTLEEALPGQFQPLELCERVVAGMPAPPRIEHAFERAFYRPPQDLVGMPKAERFDRAEDYYSTLFHELVHATGHASRVNRPEITNGTFFGSNDYSKEELVAEMGAAFLSAHCGIESSTLDNSASYLASWLKNLRGDSRLVVHAGAQAQKAVDYVLVRLGS